jgi:intracellular protein transport protein USO1
MVEEPSSQLTNGRPVPNGVHMINVIEALLKLTLEPASSQMLDVRLAGCECIKAYFSAHTEIHSTFLHRAIEGHVAGDDEIPNLLTILVDGPEPGRPLDPYQSWMASVLLFHLLYEDPDAKAMTMKITEGDSESGEEVVTCTQAIAAKLILGMQRDEDERISIGYLMLLCGWLFEEPDAVNDFLGEGSSVQSLIQAIEHSGTSKTLVPGLCAVLLGIIYEFSTKDSPVPRATLHKLLTTRLGREQYIDKITKLREIPLVRDFEVLPRTSHGNGPPEVFFDKTFIDFLKDNSSRLIRAIDRDPGVEVSVITNGVQKGISRELVDSLRGQVEDRGQALQKLESDMLTLERKLEQEQLDHRRTKESLTVELARIKQINGSLQRNHEEELRSLEQAQSNARNDMLRQHQEQLRGVGNQIRQITMESAAKANKIRERHEAERMDLKETVSKLEVEIAKAKKEHIQDLQTANEEFSSKFTILEGRMQRAEEKAEEAEERAGKAEMELKQAQTALEKLKSEVDEKDEAKNAVQGELDDLLIVFGDLEAKRSQDKVSISFSVSPNSLTMTRRND